MPHKFNVRVYGCAIKDNKILALYEEYAGEPMLKLPGGGVEFGEGLIECLKREFEEELNLKIDIEKHFYTQEEFLASRFNPNDQLLTIYYKVSIPNLEDLLILDPCIERVEWIDLSQEENPFTLPIDRIVYEKLQAL